MKLAFWAKREENHKSPINIEDPSKSLRYSLIEKLCVGTKDKIKIRSWKVLSKNGQIEELTAPDNEKPADKPLIILNAFSLSAEQR